MIKSRRCGIVVKKIGMTTLFDENGCAVAVTLLQFVRNIVVARKMESAGFYNALVIGYGDLAVPSRLSKPLRVDLKKKGIAPVLGLKEFRVSQDCILNVSDVISIKHMCVGQYVDVSAVSIGKGMAGPMKRYHFAGLEATHGVSVSHRSHGSTGQREYPGKVFKRKKMAGRLGGKKVTVQNLKIFSIDEELGVIALMGSIPGFAGSWVVLQDAKKVHLSASAVLPASLKMLDEKKEEVSADE